MILKLVRVLTLTGVALPAFAQYAGPAILSRGEAPAAMSAPEIKFRPFVELTGIYSTGLAGVATDAQGNVANVDSAGIELTFGVSGTHSWKHTKLGLDYRGSLDHYTTQSHFDSVSQGLLLGLTQQVTRHISLSLRENAGMFTQSFGLGSLSQTVPFDPSQSYIPTTTFFNNRTYYVSSQADLKIQKTTRLSFVLGGDNFLIRYGAAGLVGSTGLGAHADAQYRLSRRSTVGAAYFFQHFYYTGQYGAADVHTAAVTYARALAARLEFSASAGASHIEQTFIQSVPVDPVIAALLGVANTTEIGHFVSWIPTGSVRLSEVFHQGVAYVSASRGVVPGNGLFTTSYNNSVAAGYTYTGLRRWSLSALTSYDRGRSVGDFGGAYNSLSGGLSASRQVARSIHLVFGYNVRSYSSPNFQNYNRTFQEGRVGVGWAPGDVPLRIW
jgi:hypothetical protein